MALKELDTIIISKKELITEEESQINKINIIKEKKDKIQFTEIKHDSIKNNETLNNSIKEEENATQRDMKSNTTIYRRNERKKMNLKIRFLIGGIILSILIGIGILLYFLLSPNKPTIYKRENFITDLTYEENQIMRFQNVKTTKVFFDFGNNTTPNASQTFIEYFDFAIGISAKDKVIEDNVQKDIYTGFIFLENYMVDNQTNKMLLQNSSLLEESSNGINKRNFRNLQEKNYFNFSRNDFEYHGCIDNGTLPIMQFVFYRNGKIKRIFKPKNLITLFYDRMVEILEKVIPKIAAENFNTTYNSISEALENEYEKIKNNSQQEDSEESLNDDYIDDDLYEEDPEEEENSRIRRRNRRINDILETDKTNNSINPFILDMEKVFKNIHIFNMFTFSHGSEKGQ